MLTAHRAAPGRGRILAVLAMVIITGLASRMIHSGILLVDKYLGDALYAVMVYLLLALVRRNASPLRRAVAAAVIMTALEIFQLTLIPLEMTKSGYIVLQIIGRLLGTTFSWLDLTAYFAGIVAAFLADYRMIRSD